MRSTGESDYSQQSQQSSQFGSTILSVGLDSATMEALVRRILGCIEIPKTRAKELGLPYTGLEIDGDALLNDVASARISKSTPLSVFAAQELEFGLRQFVEKDIKDSIHLTTEQCITTTLQHLRRSGCQETEIITNVLAFASARSTSSTEIEEDTEFSMDRVKCIFIFDGFRVNEKNINMHIYDPHR
ncbi:unnamed protein product [Protopolystoma xenopodis]|uniref:Uncharacterized protein n=1 Tax=Protopolystoma xenopodis TaxID=117903 RepID=A0A448X6Q7_9PLAT|nr:unnamed protein product [Protopolystoma xenopodis]